MKLFAVNAENWKSDGGVAFGVVPRSLWSRSCVPDENNMIEVASRCLLIVSGSRKVLIDTGMGDKRDERYYGHRYVSRQDNLFDNLKKAGYSPSDITDVVFTHLHDDHVGGATRMGAGGQIEEVFPKAVYWVSEAQWQWALHPNKREAASYFPDNLMPLQQSGRLNMIRQNSELIPGVMLRIYNGHTMGQLIPVVDTGNRVVVFCADFIPSAAHIPLPYIASVDIQPLVVLSEKEQFLREAVEKNYILMFEHDREVECCTVKDTPKGVRVDATGTLQQMI